MTSRSSSPPRRTAQLKPVSFVKPIGAENEHPGYASEHEGSDHLVDLLTAIENGPQADSTLVIVTYDEFGGQFDHVAPPTDARHLGQVGAGTRIPAFVVSPLLKHDFAVDHTSHDTTSILATIETVFHVPAVADRDAAVGGSPCAEADLAEDHGAEASALTATRYDWSPSAAAVVAASSRWRARLPRSPRSTRPASTAAASRSARSSASSMTNACAARS